MRKQGLTVGIPTSITRAAGDGGAVPRAGSVATCCVGGSAAGFPVSPARSLPYPFVVVVVVVVFKIKSRRRFDQQSP